MFRRAFCLFTALAVAVSLSAPVGAVEAKAKTKDIDLVICLDISGSMDGLIDSAKAKLWDVVNDLAKAKPAPNLRVALYTYGCDAYDPKTGWVRQDIGFTTDLDKVNEKLFALRTNGGTEYVARVCRDAIKDLKWSEDKSALKLIFVCGNEPANQDPQVALKDVSELACKNGIIINTIYCGADGNSEAAGWKDFATSSEGRYASIDQNRGTVAVVTPFDKELVDLSGQINKTFVFAGREAKEKGENQIAQDSNAAKMGEAVAASRACAKAAGCYRFNEDLVERLKADPKFDVKTVKDEELSDELKKMKPEEREKHVKDQLAKRQDLEKKIAELGKKRDEYIREETKKNANKGQSALDEALRGAIREQANKKGIEIKD